MRASFEPLLDLVRAMLRSGPGITYAVPDDVISLLCPQITRTRRHRTFAVEPRAATTLFVLQTQIPLARALVAKAQMVSSQEERMALYGDAQELDDSLRREAKRCEDETKGVAHLLEKPSGGLWTLNARRVLAEIAEQSEELGKAVECLETNRKWFVFEVELGSPLYQEPRFDERWLGALYRRLGRIKEAEPIL